MLRARLALGARRFHRRAIYPILAGLLPEDCLSCGEPLGPVHLLGACPECWSALRPIRPPLCPRCGAPHPSGTDLLGIAGGLCASCVLHPWRIEAARAAVEYDRVARRLVLRAKFGGRIEILRHLGEHLARVVSLSGVAESCSLVTAVPSHPWVRLRRGFNPATEIARPVARALGIPLRRGVLTRRFRAWVPAKRMTAVARRTALRNAFRSRRLPPGERVLLVDDLLTTGATADGCAAALFRAGAESVRLAVWARTPLRR